MSFIIQGDYPRSSTNKDTPYELAGGSGAKKYLEEICYHRIKCSAANSLTAFMWRRPLNNVALVALTHKEPKGVSDGISTKVVAWMINKCRTKMFKGDYIM